MLDALLGAVIMVVATTSLLLSIEVAESAFRTAGRESLSHEENSMLSGIKASLPDFNDAQVVEIKFREMAKQVKNNLPTN